MSLTVDMEKDLGGFGLKVSFSAGDEVVSLLGPSGSGKSMTLRCIAGMEKPRRGKITVDGETLFDSSKGIDLPPQPRRTGLLFQNYALFPHMTVLQNLRAGARREGDKARREEMIARTVDRFGLGGLVGRYPHQLSGGQQQRVALARILVSGPNILLLDEPFSALDSHLRRQVEEEVRAIIREFGRTVILVSHDRGEVYRLSDRVVLMNEGRVEAQGSREDVFFRPPTRAAALLTGWDNFSRLEPTGPGRGMALDWGVELDLPGDPAGMAWVAIRKEDVAEGPGENSFPARVTGRREDPFRPTLLVTAGGSPVEWQVEQTRGRETGNVTVRLPREKLILLKG